MNTPDTEVLRQALAWLGQGQAVYLATVMQTWGSAPRQPGALLAVSADGRVCGSVSGGCIEDDLIDRAKRGALPAKPELVKYGVTADEATRFGLPCGGTLELLVEPLAGAGWLQAVLDEVVAHRLVARTLDLATGQSTLAPATPADASGRQGQACRTVYGPHWRLLIIGANQTARILAEIATALEFHVMVCDPREEFFAQWQLPEVELRTGMPDDTVLEIGVDARTAIVAVTHDPKLDDMALLEALKLARLLCRRARLAGQPGQAARAPAHVRPAGRPNRPPARPGRPAHRQPHAGRNRRGHRRRTGPGAQPPGCRGGKRQRLRCFGLTGRTPRQPRA